jgi:hypothetical protein
MIYRRLISAGLLIAFIVGIAGCSPTWRRKFVRKKKGDAVEGPVLEPEEYNKEFTNKQLYANHFVFWKSAENELIASIKKKSSAKRVDVYASHALVEIRKMYQLLVPEMQKELLPYIEELEGVVSDLKKPGYLEAHSNNLLRALSKHYRNVNSGFYYFKAQGYIKPEQEDARDDDAKE